MYKQSLCTLTWPQSWAPDESFVSHRRGKKHVNITSQLYTITITISNITIIINKQCYIIISYYVITNLPIQRSPRKYIWIVECPEHCVKLRHVLTLVVGMRPFVIAGGPLIICVLLYKHRLCTWYTGGRLSQRTAFPSIIGLAPFRAHMCTVCECMRNFTIAIHQSNSCAYDNLFQWMFGGRDEKIGRIQCWTTVRVRPVGLDASKRTIPLKKQKLSIEIQQKILCIEYNIVFTLALHGLMSCQQSQDTAKNRYARNTSELSCTLPPRNQTNIPWNYHM